MKNNKIISNLKSTICGTILVCLICTIAYGIVCVDAESKTYTVESEPYKVIEDIDNYYIHKEETWHGRYSTTKYDLFYIQDDVINKIRFGDIYINYNSNVNSVELYKNSNTFLGIKLEENDTVIVNTTKELNKEEVELIKHRLIKGKNYEY